MIKKRIKTTDKNLNEQVNIIDDSLKWLTKFNFRIKAFASKFA